MSVKPVTFLLISRGNLGMDLAIPNILWVLLASGS